MTSPTPLSGNAVLTTTTLTFLVGAIIVLLRAYGYQITGDQENALITALQGPLGEIIIATALWIGAWISRSKVWSQLSVEKMTAKVEPTP